MALSGELRSAALKMHSDDHLERRMPAARAPTRYGIVRYLTECREAHRVFRHKFPVATHKDLVKAIDADLTDLGVALETRGYPVLYAPYLDTLPISNLGCHWYNMVFAHVAGGGQVIADSIRPQMPDGWTSRYFDFPDASTIHTMRHRFDSATSAWSPAERQTCLDESKYAFGYGMKLLEMLESGSPVKKNDAY